LSDEYIENIRKELPELPESRRKRYIEEYELTEKAANFVTSSKYYSDIFDKATEKSKNPKAVSNWLMSDIARILNEKEEEADKIPFTGDELGELVELIDKGTISSKSSKSIFCKILVAGSVQDVDFSSFVFKAHDGSCNRYSALTFDFHKVGSSRFLYFVGFYSSGDMDGSSEK